MKYCKVCNIDYKDEAKFCAECGNPLTTKSNLSCIHCGADLIGYETNCPACGKPLKKHITNSTLKSFTKKLNEYDQMIIVEPKKKIGFMAWDIKYKILFIILNLFLSFIPLLLYYIYYEFLGNYFNVQIFSNTELSKIKYIQNYQVGNDSDELVEVYMYILSSMQYLNNTKYSNKNKELMHIWYTKSNQVYDKMKLLNIYDVGIKKAYKEINELYDYYMHKYSKRRKIILSILCIFIVGNIVVSKVKDLSVKDILSTYSDYEPYEWLESGLSTMLPKVENSEGHLWTNSSEKLDLDITIGNRNQYEKYIEACKSMGFNIDTTKSTNNYSAFDSNKYYLNLDYYEYSKELSIELYAPFVGDPNYIWPQSLTNMGIVEFSGYEGKVISDSNEVRIEYYYVNNNDFNAYKEQIKNLGYIYDFRSNESLFEGYKADSSYISISLENNKTMRISVNKAIPFVEGNVPENEYTKLIPPIKHHRYYMNNSSYYDLDIYIPDKTLDDYNHYVNECINMGYEINYAFDNSFKGESLFYDIDIRYYEYGAIKIRLDKK